MGGVQSHFLQDLNTKPCDPKFELGLAESILIRDHTMGFQGEMK